MRKIFFGWMLIGATCSYAQVDATSPFIWVEEEVVDTAKAVEMAKQYVAESNAKVKKQIDLLTYLKANNKKKVKLDEDIALLQDLADRYESLITKQVMASVRSSVSYALSMSSSSSPKERIQKELTKGKIDKAYFNAFDDILNVLSTQIKDEQSYPYHSFASVVSPLPKKKATVKKDNPNYGFRWLDKYDESKLKYNPVKELYTSADFPQYIFRKVKKFRDSFWAVYDKVGNLLAVKYNPYHNSDEDEIEKAGMKYDYLHNAYDINDESPAIRKALDDWFHGRSVQQRIEKLQKEQAGVLLSKELARNLAYNTVSNVKEYNAAKIVVNEYDKKERAIARQIEALKNSLPPADVQRSVDSYLRQLKSDNDDIWGWSTTYYTRLDGLNFVLERKDKTLKVKETFYWDDNLKELKCRYEILNK